jgi:hypothetical protein
LRSLISFNICITEKEREEKQNGKRKRREQNRSGTERGERKRDRKSLEQDEEGSRETITQVSTQRLETTQAR